VPGFFVPGSLNRPFAFWKPWRGKSATVVTIQQHFCIKLSANEHDGDIANFPP
jgi:hypothetical protein